MFLMMDRLLQAILTLLVILGMSSGSRQRRPSFCNSQQSWSTFLWKLKDRSPAVYFFGTIHVPYTRVWDYVPWAAKQAFHQSDSVFFELDLLDPETVSQLASCQMLPSGKSLMDVLPGDIYRRLKRHLDYVRDMMPSWINSDHRSEGLYPEYLFKAIAGNWEKKRPVWVMLMVNSLTENDIRSRGIPVLDLYLAKEANRLRKRSGAVENVEEQCLPLNGLNGSQVLFALNQTLYLQEVLRSGETANLASPTYSTEDLIRHYNCGDLDSVVFRHETQQMPGVVIPNNQNCSSEHLLLSRNIDRYFRRELIEKRNERMANRVLQLLEKYPDESLFFAFGAGHFLGNSSVLEYVETGGGFQVEQVPANANLRIYRRPHHHPRQRGSGSTDSNFSTHRRYKKRGSHHHYHTVKLLTSATPTATPSSRFRNSQKRPFNDLWVKLETKTRSSSLNFLTTPSPGKSLKNSNFWYIVPKSASVTVILRVELLFWTLCATIMAVWTNHCAISFE